MEDVLIFIQKLINNVAELPNKLTYVKTETDSPTSHSKTRGMGNIRFGIIPDYAANVKGLKIEGSSPNTPAEKAGLIDGDIIIGIDDKEINNIQDFMMVLREQQPGNTVTVKYLRDGKEMQVKVLLEAKN
jgi:S1-C subfamily serine protease